MACAEDEESTLESRNPIVSVTPDDDGIWEETGVVVTEGEEITIETPVRDSLFPFPLMQCSATAFCFLKASHLR
jgi:hypothetical protein